MGRLLWQQMMRNHVSFLKDLEQWLPNLLEEGKIPDRSVTSGLADRDNYKGGSLAFTTGRLLAEDDQDLRLRRECPRPVQIIVLLRPTDPQECHQNWYKLKWQDSWKQLWEKCRRQLDVHEMRAVLAPRPPETSGALLSPPGLADVVAILERKLPYVQKMVMLKIGVVKGELGSYRESPSFWSFSVVTFAEDAYQVTISRLVKLQLQALLQQQQQQGPRADRPETVKPGITDLPRLPEYQPTTGSIDLLNWLTHIQPIMQDLSDTSYAWWEGTLQDALSWYTKYSAASPLERLQLKPSSSQELHRPEWARGERRATAMMLSAVPQAVREEVIAMGSVTSLALLCKLYAVYQPGNLQERALVLQRLERPEECDTALQAVEALRKWTLWRRRASSIGIAEPDASVLVQGLDRITTKVVKANSELSFRVSLIRSTLQVDVCPSSQSVTTFLQHLQAEMEQQARLSVTKAPAPVSPGMRAVTPVDGHRPPRREVPMGFAASSRERRDAGGETHVSFLTPGVCWKKGPDQRSVWHAELRATRSRSVGPQEEERRDHRGQQCLEWAKQALRPLQHPHRRRSGVEALDLQGHRVSEDYMPWRQSELKERSFLSKRTCDE
ncbi:GIP [Symbiodinium necroappetens]|uniref:GIP protein n=1 Tax=Symbiodinium necroappetens TaxID=1628268 RepID=A0A812VVX6_9DINO|nr:GIP [Symbiodinium necroappetens]